MRENERDGERVIEDASYDTIEPLPTLRDN